jgi:hypothetical protein
MKKTFTTTLKTATPYEKWVYVTVCTFLFAFFFSFKSKASNETNILFTPPPTISINCANPVTPAGWMYLGTYNNSLYYKWVGSGDITYAAAKVKVAEIGGCLTVITSAAQNTFLNSALGGGGAAWLGIERQGTGWISNTGTPLSYTNWGAGEPNNYGGVENCCTITGTGQWNDLSGNATAWAIAQVKCSSPTTPVNCATPITPTGWMYVGTYNNDYYYKFTGGDQTCSGAKTKVASIGASLPVILDAAQNNFVTSKLEGGTAWLGIERDASNSWVTSTGTKISYTNWAAGEPNNYGGGENTGTIRGNGQWNDLSCNATAWVIGVIKCPASTPSCSASVTASNNGTKCANEGVVLAATGSSASTGGATNNPINLLANGNFDAGNTGFTSELTYKLGDDCGVYNISNKANAYFNWAPACSEHTGNGGKMMVINGEGGDAWHIYWKQTVAVQPNTNYEFSYWAMSLNGGNTAKLYTVINNMNTGNVSSQTNLGTTGCVWQKITFSWNSGSATQANIMLKNDVGNCSGNDFALDDMSFVSKNTASGTCSPSYNWTGPNGFTSAQQNPTVYTSGTYTVTYKDQLCCTATASTNVTIITTPNPTVTVTQPTCTLPKGTIEITNLPVGYYSQLNNDTWLLNKKTYTGLAPGTYTINIGKDGCNKTTTVTINPSPSGSINAAIGGNLSICEGTSTTLTAIGSAGTYLWSNGATTSSIVVGAGTYSLTISNGVGCSASTAATVAVTPKPTKPTLDITQPTCTLSKGSITISNLAAGQISSLDGGATTADKKIYTNIASGSHTIKVTNSNGCTNETTFSINSAPTNCFASIGNFVWNDFNNDGFQNVGEPGIGGVTVMLLNGNGTMVASTTTSAAGYYSFNNLTPGTYCVKFTTPTGFVPTKANQGTLDTNDSDADPVTGKTINVTLSAGENNTTFDAGYNRPCNNVTDAGAICCDQQKCGEYDPAPITNLTAPSGGGTAPIHYLWLRTNVDPTSGTANWAVIPNSDNQNYDPSTISQTTYFRRCVYREGCDVVKETAWVTMAVVCGTSSALTVNTNADNQLDVMEGIELMDTPPTENPKEATTFLYPNPTRDAFYIGFPSVLTENVEVTITNQTGEILERQTILANQQYFGFSVQNYTSGLYLVQIKGTTFKPLVKKLRVVKE